MIQIKEDIAVYILCGGKSSRMKTEKGLVEFHGKTFVQWILDAVISLSSTITLVTKNEEYSQFSLPMIPDLVEDKGPVGGIYTALADSKSQYNLILSCDIPKISTEVLSELVAHAVFSENKLSYLTDGIHDYPLIGCYQKSLLPHFQNAVIQNHLKLCPLVESLSPQKLLVSKDNQSALKNINSKAELQNLT